MEEAENRELFPRRVGERLAAARTAMGLDLDEVAARTRIAKRQLAAIESGDHGALPAPTYSAGFVKAYAQMVGLDGVALARDFRVELGAAPPPRRQAEPFEPADPSRIPTRLLAWTALAIAVAIAIAYALWRSPGGDVNQLAARTTPEVAAPSSNVAPAPVAPTPPPAADGPVILTATAPVWVRIYEPNGGTKYLDREMKAGESFTVPADAVDPLILTGRPQSIGITVGGKPIPPLGPPDKTVADVSLKPRALLSRADAALPVPAIAPPGTVPLTTPSPVAAPASPPAPRQESRRRSQRDAADTPLPSAFAQPSDPATPSDATSTSTPASGGNASTQTTP